MKRRYDIDALRVLAFGLLILYHVGMFYVADWDYHVKSSYRSEWLQFPMLFSNQWRMPLIFLISGLAVNFIWGKYSVPMLIARRVRRLFIPLVFGMAIVVAPQAYFEAVSKGVIEPGFWRFMGQYLTMQDFPAEAWGGAEIMTWTWTHLWYLPYLLCYTLVLIPLALVLDGPGRAIRAGFRNLSGPWLVLVPIVPLMLAGTFVYPRFPYISHDLTGDWYAHAMYFTFFLCGFLIGRDPQIWETISGMRKQTLLLAVAGFALLLAIRAFLPDEPSPLQLAGAQLAVYANRWLWILTILGWGHRWLNRPFRWLPYANEAVYPWYMLHQTIIIAVGYPLSRLSLGPVAEPMLVLLVTIGGCLLIHEFVIRRTPLLRPLFGLSYRPVAAGRYTPVAVGDSAPG